MKDLSLEKKAGEIYLLIIAWFTVVVLVTVFSVRVNALVKDAPPKKEYNASQLGKYVTLIGDSISHQSEKEIKEALPGVDLEAVNGIYFYGKNKNGNIGGYERLKKHVMRDVVVFMLGSNNGATTMQISDVVEYVGKTRKLVLMTTYVGGKEEQMKNTNNQINRFASKKDNIYVVDWYLSNYDDEKRFLLPDRLHPNEEGRRHFAELIKHEVLNALEIAE